MRTFSYNKDTRSFNNGDKNSLFRIETINELIEHKNEQPQDWEKLRKSFEYRVNSTITDLESDIKKCIEDKVEIQNLDQWWTDQESKLMDHFKNKYEVLPEDLPGFINNLITDKYRRIKDSIANLPKMKAMLTKLKSNKIQFGDEISGLGTAGTDRKFKATGIVIGFDEHNGYHIEAYKGYASWSVYVHVIGAIKLNSFDELEKEFKKINDKLVTYYVVSKKNNEIKITEVQARNSIDVRNKWVGDLYDNNGVIIADDRWSHEDGYYGITPVKELAERTLNYYKEKYNK